MTTSIGEKIIAAIAQTPLVRVVDNEVNQFNVNAVVVWSQTAAEQLEAVVEAHIEERVRIRLELDKEMIFREGYSAGYKQGENDSSRWECGGGSTHPKTRKSDEDSAYQDFITP